MTKVKKKRKKSNRAKHRSIVPWKKAAKVGLTAGVWLWDFLWSMVELMPDPAEGRREYMRRLDGWPEEVRPKRLKQELKRMKDRGWIVEAEKQGKKFIKLTEKGLLEILYRKLKELPQTRGRVWDGTWWMALFDIPEKGRAERDAIRRALCAAGFYRLQKSVYLYPRQIPPGVIAYLNAKELLSYIRFAHVNHLEGTRDAKKYFEIPGRRKAAPD